MSGNQKAKPAGSDGEKAARVPEYPLPPPTGAGLPAPMPAPVLPQIVISHDPASPEAVRLECLRIALGRGLSLKTADSKAALREAVDDYHAIVANRPFPVREAADA